MVSRSMLASLLGRLAQFAIALATVKLMTTLLAPEEVGKVSLVGTITAFFALFFINPIGMFINRRLHAWRDSGALRHYLHAYGGCLAAIALVAALVVGAVVHSGLLSAGMAAGTVAGLVAGSLIFNTANQTLIPSLNMLGRVRPFVALTLGTLLASLCLSALFVTLGHPTAELWLAGLLGGQALFSLLAYAVFFHRLGSSSGPAAFDTAKLQTLLAFCWPVAIAVGLNWAQMQGYRFAIAREGGLAALGLFTAGYGIAAAMLSAMEQVLTTWFQPNFYREANSVDAAVRAAAWHRYARTVLPLSIIGLFVVLAAAPELVVLMLGPAFHGVAPYVALGALAEWSRVAMGVFVLVAHASLQTRLLILPSAVGAGITLALVLWLLPRHGLYVPPLAVTAGALVACALVYRSARSSQHRVDLPWLQLAGAGALGAAILGLTHGLRPSLHSLGPLAPPATLVLLGALSAPVAWWYLVAHSRRP